MPLLSPAESHAFQSFLSTIDVPDDFSPEWSMYAHQLAADHPVQGKEALTKATKDLMALDRGRDSSDSYFSWSSSSSSPSSTETTQSQSSSVYPRSNSRHRQPDPQSYAHEPNYSFGYQGQSPAPFPRSSRSRSSDSVAPSRTLIPSVSTPTPSSSTSVALPRRSSKRSSIDQTPNPTTKRRRSSPTLSCTSESPSQTNKPALLTPSQKKANHIQSEQKRRANIRRGYEALCDTVPALREAIAREEEENRIRENAEGSGKSKGKKGKKKGTEETEKMDGRAGPRSENIVLQKTIDYITDLVDERKSLLAQLQRARSRLHPDHPALRPSSANAVPLWEREWTGGTGDAESDADEEMC